MNNESLVLLKREVEKVFERKILSASDCQSLSADIYEQTENRLSVNTLRRLFNLMKCKYQPSIFTLDLLSRYCGFSSYSDFITPAIEKSDKLDDLHDLESRFLELLIVMFKDMEIRGMSDNAYQKLIHELVKDMSRWPKVIDKFQLAIAQTANGQKIYFEQFINIDELNGFYGKGLRYYVAQIPFVEGKILGHSLLCLNGWLTMNAESLHSHFYAMTRYYESNSTLEPALQARVFAAQLFKATIDNTQTESLLIEARNYYDSNSSQPNSYISFPTFEYVLAEALILINMYEEAMFYIDEAIRGINKSRSATKYSQLLPSIYLFKAIALFNLGNIKDCKNFLAAVEPAKFHFLSKQFNLILYFSLIQSLEKDTSIGHQIKMFVEKTGFNNLIFKPKKLVLAA
jgi:tetratricopeptide (TPR) repeat protein